MEDIIELLHKIGKLKDLKRTGWVLRKVPNPESVADHSFRTAIMALLLADKFKLDKNKCIQMALIHDLAESIVGDITPYDKISSEDKHKLEKKAIRLLFKEIDGNELINLWEEYDERKTPEAQFVYELDRMERLLQAFEYEQRYKDENINLDEFWTSVEGIITDKNLLEILKILKQRKKV